MAGRRTKDRLMPGSSVIVAGELMWLRDCKSAIVRALAELFAQYPQPHLWESAAGAFVDTIAREIPDPILREIVRRIAATAARTFTLRKAA